MTMTLKPAPSAEKLVVFLFSRKHRTVPCLPNGASRLGGISFPLCVMSIYMWFFDFAKCFAANLPLQMRRVFFKGLDTERVLVV